MKRLQNLQLPILIILLGFLLETGAFKVSNDLSADVQNDGVVEAISRHEHQETTNWKRFEKRVEEAIEKQVGVGAEVYIEKTGKVIYHKAFGFTDPERGVRSKVGDIYNIRSMTKPMAGAVIAMLMQEGKLSLKDRVAKYLPEFDHGKTRELTIEHLLLHKGGYVQGQPGKPWTRHSSLSEMVEYWATQGPTSEVGGAWSYADAHADILGRVAEVIAQKSARQLIEEYLIRPLEMKDSFAAWTDDPKLNNRVAPQLRNRNGNWRVVWRPENGPWHDFGMFAQGVFSTSADYAKFMRLYMPKRSARHQEMLSLSSIHLAFSEREAINVPSAAFSLGQNKKIAYGHLWGLAFTEITDTWPYVFMHQGSDGTAAYAFPEQDLILIVMTQSRGGTLRYEIEKAVGDHLLEKLLN